MNLEQVAASIRNVPDFPKPGIVFKDITTEQEKLVWMYNAYLSK
jgi:adenine/guanine phosphoribosyltransferase-like PRPP-binding protein